MFQKTIALITKIKKEMTEVNSFPVLSKKGLVPFLTDVTAKSRKDIPSFFAPINGKVKLAPTDTFGHVIDNLSQQYIGKTSPIITAHAGGFFEVASLYANIAHVTKGKPHLIVHDKSEANSQNTIYNTILIQLFDTRAEFIVNMFGLSNLEVIRVFDNKLYDQLCSTAYNALTQDDKEEQRVIPQEEIEKYINTALLTDEMVKEVLNGKFKLSKLEDYITSTKRDYGSNEHYKKIMNIAEEKIKNRDTLKLFNNVAKNVTAVLGNNDRYLEFTKKMFANINTKENKATHILRHDHLFDAYKGIIDINTTNISDTKTYFHVIPGVDLSQEEELEKLSTIYKKYKITNKNDSGPAIDISYIPHMRRFDEIVSFLKANAQNAIYAIRDKNTGIRAWDSKQTIELIDTKHAIFAKGLEPYETELANRVPLGETLTDLPDFKGFGKTMFLPGMEIGNPYSDEKTIENLLDIAEHDKVETLLMYNAIYPSFSTHQLDRRKIKHPKYNDRLNNLDVKLKRLQEIKDRAKANGTKIVYQMGYMDQWVAKDLYLWSLFEREGEKTPAIIRKNRFRPERQEYDQREDEIKHMIYYKLIPYLIRAGQDLTTYVEEDEEYTRITEMINAIKAYEEGNMTDEQRELINPEFLENTDNFEVVFSGSYANGDGENKLELYERTSFSPQTQYKKVLQGLQDNVQQLQNGSATDANGERFRKGNIHVDQSQYGFMAQRYQKDFIVSPPALVDDKRYLDPDFLPGAKNVNADGTHKRMTVRRMGNDSGAYMFFGDSDARFGHMIYNQRILTEIESIAKTGKGTDGEIPTDRKVLVINDTQFGSVTERPYELIKMLSYAMEQKVTDVIFGGDQVQGHNFKGMPWVEKETAAMSPDQQLENFINLIRPYIKEMMPNLQSVTGILGNHEKDTDRNRVGFNLINRLRDMIEYEAKLYQQEHPEKEPVTLNFNDRQVVDNGDMVGDTFSGFKINGYRVALSHKYSERGSGKGSAEYPVTQLQSWARTTGALAKNFDFFIGNHYHIDSFQGADNKLFFIFPGFNGLSEYEIARGYNGPIARGTIMNFNKDGRVMIESVAKEFLGEHQMTQIPEVYEKGKDFLKYKYEQEGLHTIMFNGDMEKMHAYVDELDVSNPEIADLVVDAYISASFATEVGHFGGKAPEKMQRLYPRTVRYTGKKK